MSVTLSEEKNELIAKIAKCQGFENYKLEVKSGSMKGDGYLGIIETIHIQDTKQSKKELNLIMKSAMTAEKLRETAPVRKAYEREIFMYETVFPVIRQFSDEVGITNKFTGTAKCYGSLSTDRQECIVLENLKEIDFKLWNRKIPMDAEHAAVVFAAYAKFHSIGFTLKILNPEKFEYLSKDLKNIFANENENDEEQKQKWLERFKHIFSNGFKAVAHNEKSTKAFTRFVQNFQTMFTKLKEVDKYSTILHGDCWCNNMMFRYNDSKNSGKPTEVCLLDWQLSNVGSPVLDLSYFFYACCSKEVLYEWTHFLKIYHENFIKTLEEAGLDPEIFAFEELENQWKTYSSFGLFMALLVMKVILTDSEEAPDLSELAEKGMDILESISSSGTTNMKAVNKRIADIIEVMDEFGFL